MVVRNLDFASWQFVAGYLGKQVNVVSVAQGHGMYILPVFPLLPTTLFYPL